MCPSTMRVSVRPVLKAVFSRAVSALTRHHVALLAPEAADEQLIFRLRAPYRLRDRVLTIELLEPGNGRLTAILVGYDGHFPRVPLWQSEPANYAGPVSFVFDPDSGDVRLGAQTWGRSVAPEGRRFCWRFELVTERGTVRRLTGHYRPADGRLVDQSYYYGDDYVDYAEQSQGDHAMVLGLLREFSAAGPPLEIGCATGQLLATLAREGYDVSGVDFSEWAVAQAALALGPDRAFQCDVESEALPAAIVLRTPHADSLSHRIFVDDWEGHFDWTHHGVDAVSLFVATFREWFAADARFRRLLTERDLGDFLLCVAIRRIATRLASRCEPRTCVVW